MKLSPPAITTLIGAGGLAELLQLKIKIYFLVINLKKMTKLHETKRLKEKGYNSTVTSMI